MIRFVTLLIVTLVCGCSGSNSDEWSENRPETYPVQGTVTLDGEPLTGATVIFRSEDSEVAASGISDDEGQFQLKTFTENDGAVAGNHLVIVTKYDPKTLPENVDLDEVDTMPEPELLTPKKYSQFETSGLTVTVEASQENQINLELKQ